MSWNSVLGVCLFTNDLLLLFFKRGFFLLKIAFCPKSPFFAPIELEIRGVTKKKVFKKTTDFGNTAIATDLFLHTKTKIYFPALPFWSLWQSSWTSFRSQQSSRESIPKKPHLAKYVSTIKYPALQMVQGCLWGECPWSFSSATQSSSSGELDALFEDMVENSAQ